MARPWNCPWPWSCLQWEHVGTACLIPPHLYFSPCSSVYLENMSLETQSFCGLLRLPLSRSAFPRAQLTLPCFSIPDSHCSQVRPRLPFLARRHILPPSLSCAQSPGSPGTPVGTGSGLGSEPVLSVLTPGMGSQLSRLSSTQTVSYAWDWKINRSGDTIRVSGSGEEALCPLRGKQSLQGIPCLAAQLSVRIQPQVAVTARAPRPWPGPAAAAAAAAVGCHSLATHLY